MLLTAAVTIAAVKSESQDKHRRKDIACQGILINISCGKSRVKISQGGCNDREKVIFRPVCREMPWNHRIALSRHKYYSLDSRLSL